MIKKIQSFFSQLGQADTGEPEDTKHAMQVASAALMVEVAKADSRIAPQELEAILDILKKEYRLNNGEVDALLELAHDRSNQSSSLYELACQLDKILDSDAKKWLIKNLWQVAFVDKDKDKYEESLLSR